MCKFNKANDLELKCESEGKSRKESEEKDEKLSDEKTDKNSLNKKNYSKNEFQEIKDYRKEISKMNVFKRKKMAIDKYINFIKNENNIKENDKETIKAKYIKIMCLLLIDNTNKDIVKLYLNFIKVNSNFIEENNLLPYEIEINNYKILFTVEEMEQIEKNIKNKSQKDIFLDYIVSLSQKAEGQINFELSKSIKDSAEKELNNLFLFNTPIEFDNEELTYYKSYYNIIFETSKQNYYDIKDYLENKKNVIEYILKKDMYNNQDIIYNEDKMNLLGIYLMKEKISKDSKEEGTVNFNRLIQKMPVTKEDFQEIDKKIVNKKNFLYEKNNKYYIEHIYKSDETSNINEFEENKLNDKSESDDSEEGVSFKLNVKLDLDVKLALENTCIQNLFDSRLESKNDKKMFFTLNKLMSKNDLTPYITDIKKFLKTIVDKKVYQQALKILFPNDFNCLISNNNEEIKQYIDERIKFYPFQNLDLLGITDKLSCYSFIPSINFILTESKKKEKSNEYIIVKEKKGNKEAYIVGLTIVNSIHEVNHANQIIIFFKGNDKNLIDSPERIIKENFSISEGGISLEYLLFGKMVERLSLFESLYIINENNYDQDLEEFRVNFTKIESIVRETKGETKFIKINSGIFKSLYDRAIKDIKKIINDLEKETILMAPKIYIKKSKMPEDNIEYIIKNKCAVFGGWKPH